MSDTEMTDAELDAWLKKANDDLLASLRKHIDVEAGLREVLRVARASGDWPPQPIKRRVRLLLRAYRIDILCAVVAVGGALWLLGMAS